MFFLPKLCIESCFFGILTNNMMPKNNPIPFHKAAIGDEEINEVVDTLKSGWLTMGPKTIEFEKQFAEYVDVKHAVSMNSATAC